MNYTLPVIAKGVLSLRTDGLSKVRFAKTLYFVHKELVRASLLNAQAIAYIRMPLGPVPDGFMLLDDDTDIKVNQRPTGLIYDTSVFSLSGVFAVPVQLKTSISKTLAKLDDFSTSQLVEISHRDPGWIEHTNGQRYFISSRDLRNTLPKKTLKLDEIHDEQAMQAKLIDGMLTDIVEESTALEYPDE
jgi:hypothetical protein